MRIFFYIINSSQYLNQFHNDESLIYLTFKVLMKKIKNGKKNCDSCCHMVNPRPNVIFL